MEEIKQPSAEEYGRDLHRLLVLRYCIRDKAAEYTNVDRMQCYTHLEIGRDALYGS